MKNSMTQRSTTFFQISEFPLKNIKINLNLFKSIPLISNLICLKTTEMGDTFAFEGLLCREKILRENSLIKNVFRAKSENLATLRGCLQRTSCSICLERSNLPPSPREFSLFAFSSPLQTTN
jgi:hypothetical protein